MTNSHSQNNSTTPTTRSLGCSPESAQRIINLLFRESSGDALLLLNTFLARASTRPVQAPPMPPKPDRGPGSIGGPRKVTPEIIAFIHTPAIRALSIPLTRIAVLAQFGVSMASSSIYKVWKLPPPKLPPTQPKKDSPRRNQ